MHNFWWLLTIAVSLVLMMFLSTAVQSHSFYEQLCCHDNDCAPVTKIEKHPDGDLLTSEHGTVLITKDFPDEKRRKSEDDQYHVCMRKANDGEPHFNGMKALCVYFPALY